ncbi:hypothetical protein [Virgibacillus sediminis]|uniref:DUF3311 domain-containing protein n=1 Tax=Virgibacillus sediminis TaxID=202260 RepID=A0ABV7A5D0_9BACI
MIKNIVWIIIILLLFIGTSGPVILIFDNPMSIYIWYVIMGALSIIWFIYGVNHVPFLAGKKKK